MKFDLFLSISSKYHENMLKIAHFGLFLAKFSRFLVKILDFQGILEKMGFSGFAHKMN